MTQTNPDLPVRLASALVMLAVAGGALLLGGWWWLSFAGAVGLVALAEFLRLLLRMKLALPAAFIGILAGITYFAFAALFVARSDGFALFAVIGAVVMTDSAAYFTGRAFGGPKIAPRISPSKTWAGLIGGTLWSAMWLMVCSCWLPTQLPPTWTEGSVILAIGNCAMAAMIGAGLAVAAQAGDFLESWMKRRAGVKDSSRLIPGHGGVFDRVDGLIGACFVLGSGQYLWEGMFP